MSATTAGGDYFPFNELDLKSRKTLKDSALAPKANNRMAGMDFKSNNAGIRSKVATASMGANGSAALMPPAPIFSFFDFGKKKEDPPVEEEKKSGFSNPFASLFSGSNLKEPKKNADGKNFFDVQATTI